MRVAVMGASGRLGRHVVERARNKGWEVVAFMRDPAGYEEQDGLDVVAGDVREFPHVAAAIDGADAVVSTIGGEVLGGDADVRAEGMRVILTAMDAEGVDRIVAIGGIGVLPTADGRQAYETEAFPEAFKQVSTAHAAAHAALKASDARWTFICPPSMVDVLPLEPNGHAAPPVTFEAVAALIVHAIDADTLIGSLVGVGPSA